jgi:hypothetical protein
VKGVPGSHPSVLGRLKRRRSGGTAGPKSVIIRPDAKQISRGPKSNKVPAEPRTTTVGEKVQRRPGDRREGREGVGDQNGCINLTGASQLLSDKHGCV